MKPSSAPVIESGETRPQVPIPATSASAMKNTALKLAPVPFRTFSSAMRRSL